MALTKVTGDFIKAGSITQGHLHSSHGITTSHIAEGDKLFFTNARVDSRIGSLSSSDLSEGTNLYYTDARARAAISATGSLSYNSTTGVMSFTMPAQNTSNITEGSNLYYTDARADARIAAADTGDLSEGTNLYYTQARFNTAFTAKSTSDLSEGTNLYYTDARADARITAADTDSLSEGSTNLYYTDARADARVALIVDSAPSTLDTLNELAAALGDDENFSTTITTSIATKMPLAGGTFTGGLTISDSILISYTGSDASNRDAGIKIINDSSDWGIIIDKGSATGNNYGVRINTDGGNGFSLYNSAGVNKINFTGAGNATFVGTISASNFSGSSSGTNTGDQTLPTASSLGAVTLTGNQTISGTKTFDNGSIVISGTHGTISFMDTTSGEDNFYLHTNSNNFYVLADRDATDAIDGGYDSPHPLQLEGDTNTAYVFGSALNISNWNTAYGWGDHGAAGYLTTSGKAADSHLLDGKDHTDFGATLATYGTTAASSGRIRCTAPFNTNSAHMFQIMISLYGSYTQHTYIVSAYMYPSTNQWYSPQAIYLGTGSPDIIVGRDSNGKAYISIANGNYMGVRVHNMTRGYQTSVADTYDPWTITVDAGTENSVTPSIYKTWTSGNDGSGSGLDADLLDGQHASAFQAAGSYLTTSGKAADSNLLDGFDLGGTRANVANKVVRTDVNGYTNFGWINTTSGNTTGTITDFYVNTNDGYIRKATKSHVLSQLGIAAGATNVTNNNQLTNGAGYTTNTGTLTNSNDRNYITDTRSASRAPSYYDDRYAQWDFSQSTNFGVSGGDSWAGILTVSKWSSWDASHRQEQLIFSGTKLARRVATSDTAWSSTYDIIDTSGIDNVKAGYIQSSASLRAPTFYDSDNTNYYVNPTSTSNLSKAIFNTSSTGLPRQITIKEDGDTENSMGSYPGAWTSALNIQSNDASTYLWLSPLTSNIPRIQTNYGQLDFYTGNNSNRALHLSGTSARSEVFYDLSDTNAYFSSEALVLRSGDPTIYMRDTNHRSVALHNNSNRLYVLGAPVDSTSYAQISGVWPWYVQLDTNDVYTGSVGYAGASYRAPIFYDRDNTGYYVNPASTSRLLNLDFGVAGYYLKAGDWGMRNQTPYGWIQFGPANSGHAHIYTDRSNFYFNAQIQLLGGSTINQNDIRSQIFYDSNDTGYYLNPASTSNLNAGAIQGTWTMSTQKALVADNYGRGVYGIYNSYRFQHLWSMGTAYNLDDSGTSTGNLYGVSWSHPNAGGAAANLSDHGMLVLINGGYRAAISGSIRCVTDMRTPIYYDSNNTGYYMDPSSTSNTVNMYAVTQMRAPIYYSITNTAYYTRPHTSSYINSLHTAGNIQAGSSGSGNIYIGGTSGNYFRFHTNNSHTYFDANVGNINWRQGASTRFTFYMTTANMTINGSLTQNSDERVKENIVEIPNAIDKVKAMKGVYYNRTDFNTGVTKVGVLAQEVEAVLPELIVEAPDSGLKSVAYGELTAVLINAVKEQQTIIDDLKSRLETLENQ